MANLTDLLSHVPNNLRKGLEGTQAESLFWKAQVRMLTTESHHINTACGGFNFETPMGTHGGEYIANEIEEIGCHEPMLTEALCAELGKNDVYYDIGAHIGYFLGLADDCGVSPANIHAFEGHPMRSEYLKNRFFNINIIDRYVGEARKEVKIDEYAAANRPPTLIKIDVEGEEFNVLKSAAELLSKHHPRIYAELHTDFLKKRGQSSSECIQLLRSHDYQIEAIDHRGVDSEWERVEGQLDRGNYLIRARN